MLYFLAYILIVFPLAYAHDAITRWFGKLFGQTIFSNENRSTYWTIVGNVKRRRACIIVILITFVLGTTYTTYQLLKLTSHLYDVAISTYCFFAIATLIIAYFVQELLDYDLGLVEQKKHANYISIQKILENLSITAGIKTPQLILYAGSVPKLFLRVPAIGAPRLHVSTSFLQHFSAVEAEAYVAHEIGHYLSKEVTTQRIVEGLITTFKITGLLSFLLMLGLRHPSIPFVWLGIYSLIVLKILSDEHQPGRAMGRIHVAFLVMNPVHLAAVLISGIIHHAMNYGEIVYADLKALELTRFPQGIYSLLKKIQTMVTDEVRQTFSYSTPIVAYHMTNRNDTFKQKLIEDRLRLVRSFDQTVTESHSPLQSLACSVCDHELTQVEVLGPYSIPTAVWSCRFCAHLWFDGSTFYALSSVDTKNYFTEYIAINASEAIRKPPYSCPRCVVALSDIRDKSLPKNITIHHCSSCRGNLAHTKDFLSYMQYRLSLQTTAHHP